MSDHTAVAVGSDGLLKRQGFVKRLFKDIRIKRNVYLMLLPVVAFYVIFHYGPMYGAQIAFKNFRPSRGIMGSEWIGLGHFVEFFNSYYIVRLLRNTIVLNLMDIAFGFPAPIILALLLNELRNKTFKKVTQTITYLPHFISLVVICGFVIDFLRRDGLINQILGRVGIEAIPFMIIPGWFKPIFVISNIWQHVGWSSIIYLAALSAINPEIYEAARIDGASRWNQLWSVTIPGILPTIIILMILRIGRMMEVGVEKILLLYNPTIYESADVITSFVYRKGLIEADYSYSAAIGLFNSVINFSLLVVVNRISKRLTETSLW